jgi:superfamily II DNA or RNA helicase
MLVAHTMGAGKTLTALSVAYSLVHGGAVGRVVVTSTTTMVRYWQQNAARASVARETLVMSHERLFRRVRAAAGDGPAARTAVDGALLIVDEAHNLRTEVSGRPKAGSKAADFLLACSRAARVLLLTGTPIVNRVADLRNAVLALDGLTAEEGRGLHRKGAGAVAALAGRLSMYYERPDRTPDRIDRVHEMTMTPEFHAKYRLVAEQSEELIDASLSGRRVNLELFINGIRRAVNGFRNMKSEKIKLLEALLPAWLERGEKVAMYTAWVEFGVQFITDVLRGMGVEHEVVDGKKTGRARSDAVGRFNSGAVSVIVFTAAGSEGMDLVGARHVVVMEPHWNMARIEQAAARAIRVGSHDHLPPDQRNVTVHMFVLKMPRPAEAPLSEGAKLLQMSADDIVLEIATEKVTETQRVLDDMKRVAIAVAS